MSDEDILKLSYKRPSRFGELFDRHHKRFILVARRALRTGYDAEDVVQEVFVRIYKYGRKFSLGNGQFRPWANTILKNCIADQINKYKNTAFSLTEEMESTTADPSQYDDNEKTLFAAGSESVYDLGDNKSYARSVLKKISASAAEIINLRYFLGKSFKEIAKILNIKSSTARVRAHRSKKIFMQAYKQFNSYE